MGTDGQTSQVKIVISPGRYCELTSRNNLKFTIYAQNRAGAKAAPKWQWNGTSNVQKNSMMLNTDFELMYDVENDATGEPHCTLGQGTSNPCNVTTETYNIVQEYVEVGIG